MARHIHSREFEIVPRLRSKLVLMSCKHDNFKDWTPLAKAPKDPRSFAIIGPVRVRFAYLCIQGTKRVFEAAMS